MSINKDNLKKFLSDDLSDWRDKSEERKKIQPWRKRSIQIAIRILEVLREKDITQKELAERMQVSSQYVNKLVKGSENLSLETIEKLESTLNINLITVTSFHAISKSLHTGKTSTNSSEDFFIYKQDNDLKIKLA